MRGIELLYFKLSYKLKEIKDNLIEKHLKNLLIKPSQNNLDSPINNKLPSNPTKEFLE
jgi:hypothetical protein